MGASLWCSTMNPNGLRAFDLNLILINRRYLRSFFGMKKSWRCLKRNKTGYTSTVKIDGKDYTLSAISFEYFRNISEIREMNMMGCEITSIIGADDNPGTFYVVSLTQIRGSHYFLEIVSDEERVIRKFAIE